MEQTAPRERLPQMRPRLALHLLGGKNEPAGRRAGMPGGLPALDRLELSRRIGRRWAPARGIVVVVIAILEEGTRMRGNRTTGECLEGGELSQS